MIAEAKRKGLGPESVDSVYLKGDEAILEHERRNGYDKPWGPGGVQKDSGKEVAWVPEGKRHIVV